MGVPFADASSPEVCARVIYRCVERTWHQRKQDEMSGVQAIQAVIDALDVPGGSPLRSCALAAFYHVSKGKKLVKWRDTAVQLSRMGYGFRRCWFDDYKANRRAPRVTNRGG